MSIPRNQMLQSIGNNLLAIHSLCVAAFDPDKRIFLDYWLSLFPDHEKIVHEFGDYLQYFLNLHELTERFQKEMLNGQLLQQNADGVFYQLDNFFPQCTIFLSFFQSILKDCEKMRQISKQYQIYERDFYPDWQKNKNETLHLSILANDNSSKKEAKEEKPGTGEVVIYSKNIQLTLPDQYYTDIFPSNNSRAILLNAFVNAYAKIDLLQKIYTQVWEQNYSAPMQTLEYVVCLRNIKFCLPKGMDFDKLTPEEINKKTKKIGKIIGFFPPASLPERIKKFSDDIQKVYLHTASLPEEMKKFSDKIQRVYLNRK